MTTSLTSGLPSRDTCVNAPPSTDAFVRPRVRVEPRRRIQHLHLRQARGRPAADHGIAAGGQTRDRHLEDQRRHVLVVDDVELAVRRTDGVRVHEIEHLAEVDGERLLALTDEQPAGLATRNRHGVDVVGRVGGVVGDRLVADVVDGLREHRRVHAARGVRERPALIAPIAANELDGIGLDDVQAVAIEHSGADAAGHGRDHRHRHRALIARGRRSRATDPVSRS